MGPRNLEGPGPIDLSAPEPVDGEQLRKRLDAREWVVDLRDRVAYAGEHLEGSIGIELGNQFSTYLGWLIPWGTSLTLIGETADQVARRPAPARADRDRPSRRGRDRLAVRTSASPTATWRPTTWPPSPTWPT